MVCLCISDLRCVKCIYENKSYHFPGLKWTDFSTPSVCKLHFKSKLTTSERNACNPENTLKFYENNLPKKELFYYMIGYMISLTLQKTRELYGDFQLHQMPVLLQFDPIIETVKNAT